MLETFQNISGHGESMARDNSEHVSDSRATALSIVDTTQMRQLRGRLLSRYSLKIVRSKDLWLFIRYFALSSVRSCTKDSSILNSDIASRTSH